MFPVGDVIPPRRTPFVTLGLLAANGLVFLYALQLERGELVDLTRRLGAVPSDLTWTTLVTGAFVHDAWILFAANMLALWIFGENVEDGMGHATYLLFYLSSAAIAAGTHAALNPASAVPLVGASGPVAAVIAAYFVVYPRSRVLTAVVLILYFDVIEVPAIFFVGVWVLTQILMDTVTAAGGAFAVHLAGFAVGAAAGAALRHRSRWA